MRNQLINSNTNFKEYFLLEDNCRSLQNEVIFSIVRRYNCFAGCKICYVDKYFEKNKTEFQRFVPEVITQETSDQWERIFSNYTFASTIDDLYWMKHQQPHLFAWYKDHANIFHFGSMTDNNFIRASNILLNEIAQPMGIYEFTFSDAWLVKIRIDEVIEKLDLIHKRMPISIIKLIQTDLTSLEWEPVKKLIQWLNANEIHYGIHHDAKTFDTIQLEVNNQHQSYASYNGDIFTVCGEADYLQYDSFFHTLVDAINPNCEPYYTMNGGYNIDEHLYKHINGKIDVYKRYIEKLKYANIGITKYYKEYFQWVIDNLVTHEDYTFIPSISFKPFHQYAQSLENNGWMKTPYGLLKDPNKIIPLFEFKS